LIASQVPPTALAMWHVADAICDRLIHRACRLTLIAMCNLGTRPSPKGRYEPLVRVPQKDVWVGPARDQSSETVDR